MWDADTEQGHDRAVSPHCRWRARQIIKNIPPSEMGQIRAKVAAMAALGGLREAWGCQRSWARDYLSLVSAARGFGVPHRVGYLLPHSVTPSSHHGSRSPARTRRWHCSSPAASRASRTRCILAPFSSPAMSAR